MDAFYLRDGDTFVATELTRGPWSPHQHGGPPAALVATAFDAHGDDAEDWFVARLNYELHRPVPIGRLAVEVRSVRKGRTVERLEAALVADGKTVLTAQCLRIRRRPSPTPEPPPVATWPAPEDCEVFVFPFFTHEVGYQAAVELRVAHGTWGSTPVGMWTRPKVPLVRGEPTSALARLVTLADAQSGMGVPLDPMQWSFINPDLGIYFERDPVGPWIGFDIRSSASTHGSGLCQSGVRDLHGGVARSAQTVVVQPR